MKSYNVGGRFTLMITSGNVKAITKDGTEQKLERDQAAKMLRKAHKEKTINK